METGYNHFTQLFEKSRDLVFSTDDAGHIEEINAAGLEMLGLSSQEEVVGRSLRDFYFDKSIKNYFLEKLKEKGHVSNFEIILVKKNGEKLFCIEDAYLLSPEEPERLRYVGVIKDISTRVRNDTLHWRKTIELAHAMKALKAYRRRLDNVLDWGKQAWWEIDVHTGAITFSDFRAESLGFETGGFTSYTDFLDLVHPGDRGALYGQLRSLTEGRAHDYEMSYRIADRSGNYHLWYERAEALAHPPEPHIPEPHIPEKIGGVSIEITGIKEKLQDVD